VAPEPIAWAAASCLEEEASFQEAAPASCLEAGEANYSSETCLAEAAVVEEACDPHSLLHSEVEGVGFRGRPCGPTL